MKWQLQHAKARFSEMVDRAIKDGPQIVTRHGREVAVLIPVDEYRRLRPRSRSFKQFLASAPKDDLQIVRHHDTGRKIRF